MPGIISGSPVNKVITSKLQDGYQCKSIRRVLGFGKVLYSEISGKILNGKWPNTMTWAKIYSQGSNDIGDLLLTHTRCFGVWSVNPCRITTKTTNSFVGGKGDETIFAYRTVDGHLLQGEESYRLRYRESSNEVELQIITCARINSIFRPFLEPFIRPLQDRFLRESVVSFSPPIV